MLRCCQDVQLFLYFTNLANFETNLNEIVIKPLDLAFQYFFKFYKFNLILYISRCGLIIVLGASETFQRRVERKTISGDLGIITSIFSNHSSIVFAKSLI